MYIPLRVNNSAAEVVGTRDVVVDSVALALRGLHGVRSGALLGEVDDGVRFLVLEELNELSVVLGDVEVDKFNFLTTHLARIEAMSRRLLVM